jgi:hypothetical protein
LNFQRCGLRSPGVFRASLYLGLPFAGSINGKLVLVIEFFDLSQHGGEAVACRKNGGDFFDFTLEFGCIDGSDPMLSVVSRQYLLDLFSDEIFGTGCPKKRFEEPIS